MAYDFNTKTFNQNIKSAYNPDLTKEDKIHLLNYFLAYKSEVIDHSDGCPPSVENVLQHLKECTKPSELESPYRKTANWQDNTVKYIVITVISSVLDGIVLQILSPYLLPKIKLLLSKL